MRLFSLQKTFARTLLKATRLTNSNKLMDATRLIQRTLAKNAAVLHPVSAMNKEASPVARASVQPYPAPLPEVIILEPEKDRDTGLYDSPKGRNSSFTLHQFVFEGDVYPYRLYIPSLPASAFGQPTKMPLIVLLHGCKQDALDFSHGTAMNTLAENHQAMVLYPEQVISSNAMRCWNWFDPNHQQTDQGEPGMIAALTLKMIAECHADPARIYVAGLSAGGAMAAVVAHLYPLLFAAVGVHSGLAAGAAQSMMQAFSAMQEGSKGSRTTAMPTIVFHGTADQTVNPNNGKYVVDAALTAYKAKGQELVKSKASAKTLGEASGGASQDEPAERTTYSNAAGKPFVESWRIPAGPHAWSGGNSRGSYTDPDGPDASKAMLAFFLQHRRDETLN